MWGREEGAARSAEAGGAARAWSESFSRSFFMKSFILRSCSIILPSSFHSFSNSTCSLSAWCFSAAISCCAASRASYALFEISMIRAISFFFSASSRSSFL